MNSMLCFNVVYIGMIVYLKIWKPNYTMVELETDFKSTVNYWYRGVILPLQHLLSESDKTVNITAKQYSKRGVGESKCLGHFDSWKLHEDKTIHPILQDAVITHKFQCSSIREPNARDLDDSDEVEQLSHEEIIKANWKLTVPLKPNKHPIPPSGTTKSATQFGDYVPSIQQWQDRSTTEASHPPVPKCNC